MSKPALRLVTETCEECAALRAENAQLTEEVGGLLITVRKQGREIGSLRSELTKIREDSSDADLVRRTLTYWKRRCGKSDRVKIGMTGERAKRVRWAIRLGYEADDFKAMIDGLWHYPFLVFGERRASGAAGSRKDDILDALRSEKSIETLIRLGRADVRVGQQMTTDGEAHG